MISPLYAANNLIIRAKDADIALSHLKLQKLLYMLYARFAAEFAIPLFPNRFEAWQYGPVITEVYGVFKKYGSRNINEPYMDSDGQIMVVAEEGGFKECFDDLWDRYGAFSGSALVGITHEEGSAWYKAVLRDNKLYGGLLEDEHIREDGTRWFNRKHTNG